MAKKTQANIKFTHKLTRNEREALINEFHASQKHISREYIEECFNDAAFVSRLVHEKGLSVPQALKKLDKKNKVKEENNG
jgi:hypothetical protein